MTTEYTSKLSGTKLAWAVALAQGMEVTIDNLYEPPTQAGAVLRYGQDDGDYECFYQPDTSWAQGGEIIEAQGISLDYEAKLLRWTATRIEGSSVCEEYGPTALIAAMRCYVASQLGACVEVPDELAVQP